jgi:hypothetical protein
VTSPLRAVQRPSRAGFPFFIWAAAAASFVV